MRARLTAAGITPPTQLYFAPDGIAQGTAANNFYLNTQRFKPRAINKERTDPATPQVQGSIRITENLQLKLAWSREMRLPNIEDGSGITGIITSGTSFTINANEVSGLGLGGDGSITVPIPACFPKPPIRRMPS